MELNNQEKRGYELACKQMEDWIYDNMQGKKKCCKTLLSELHTRNMRIRKKLEEDEE